VEDPAAPFSGTSAATPHVSAAVAMMLSLQPAMGYPEVRAILQRTGRKAAPGTFCASAPLYCGGGMLDAEAAVVQTAQAFTMPFATASVAPGFKRRGELVTLSATAVGATDFTWTWQQIDGPTATLVGNGLPSVDARMPALASGSLVFQVTATSASMPSLSAQASITVDVNEPPTVPTQAVTVEPGKPLRLALGITDPDDAELSVTYLGTAHDGMSVTAADGGTLLWNAPPAGSYAFSVVAVDPNGLASSNNIVVTVAQPQAPAATESAGGGAAGPWWSLALLLAAALLRPTRRARRPDASVGAARVPRD
jgi:serine protease